MIEKKRRRSFVRSCPDREAVFTFGAAPRSGKLAGFTRADLDFIEAQKARYWYWCLRAPD